VWTTTGTTITSSRLGTKCTSVIRGPKIVMGLTEFRRQRMANTSSAMMTGIRSTMASYTRRKTWSFIIPLKLERRRVEAVSVRPRLNEPWFVNLTYRHDVVYLMK
jgi:hypothetical protein